MSEQKSKTEIVVTLSKKALALQNGKQYHDNVLATEEARENIATLQQYQEKAKNENFGLFVTAILHGHAVDPENINPMTAIEGSAKDWQRQTAILRQMLGYEHPDGSPTEIGLDMFPDFSVDKDERDDVWKRKKQRKDNLSTSMRKACEVAVAYIDAGAEVSIDEETRLVRIDNPGKLPKSIIGKEKTPLLMDNRQRTGADEKAGFESLRRLAYRKHDQEKFEKKFGGSKGGGAGSENAVAKLAKSASHDDVALGEACNIVISAVTAMENQVSKEAEKHLRNLVEQVSKFLETAEVV